VGWLAKPEMFGPAVLTSGRTCEFAGTPIAFELAPANAPKREVATEMLERVTPRAVLWAMLAKVWVMHPPPPAPPAIALFGPRLK
jgi:hypothetical protein